jgi:hypothetical protein
MFLKEGITLNSSMFEDGNRLVLVCENWTEEDKLKIQELFSPTILDKVQAKPMKKQLSQNQQSVDVDLSKALEELKSDKVNNQSDRSFRFVGNYVNTANISSEEKQAIKQVLNRYLAKRFKDVDVDRVVSGFTDGNCMNYIETFDAALDKMWSKFGYEKAMFNTLSLEDKRIFIGLTMRIFKSLNEHLSEAK